MTDYTLTLEVQPSQSDISTINQWIVDYNLAQVGDHWKGRLTIVARHERQLLGGIYGFTDRSWLRVEVMVVQEQFRYLGIGTRLLQTAEAEACHRGCHAAWLDTFSFQALPFYQRLGYTIFGTLEQYPDTHTRYFLRKSLAVP